MQLYSSELELFSINHTYHFYFVKNMSLEMLSEKRIIGKDQTKEVRDKILEEFSQKWREADGCSQRDLMRTQGSE